MKELFVLLLILQNILLFAGNVETITTTDGNSTSQKLEFIVNIPSTPIKNQYKTSTCWGFSGISLIETELIRTGKGAFDLSEMFIIHHDYERKAERYVRMHGKNNFSPGGETNDVTDVINEYGILPEEVYTGLKVDAELPVHSEMDRVLEKYISATVTNPDKESGSSWTEEFSRLLDSYLGEIPENFYYNGDTMTPISFAQSLDLDPDKYVMITSFLKYPYFEKVILEIPDNWSWAESYNLPLDVLESVVDTALYKGYSVAWATDISETGFNFERGLALVPYIQYSPESVNEGNKWRWKTEEEKESTIFSLLNPVEELEVTPELRQQAFDNYSTTDDHGMHIIGIAKDKNGRQFYYVKNSWGTDNPYEGYLYVSKPYFQYKTISIMLNRDALTPEILGKLKL